jgi:hypothetical protein
MTKMKAKNLSVFFLAVATFLFSVAFASAAPLADIYNVEVDGMYALDNDVSVIAGETMAIKVYFRALEDASDVRIEAELEGEKIDVSDKTTRFDVEDDYLYKKTLSIKIPSELRDEVSDKFFLTVKVWNSDHQSETEMEILIQRPTYSAKVMAITTDQEVKSGNTLPVDVVIRNVGYNELEDLYVKISIPELGIEKTAYFGDVVAQECYEEGYCNGDNDDVIKGRFYLKIPYDAQAGTYELVVNVKNYDLDKSESVKIKIENDFSGSNVIANELSKSFATNVDAEYFLILTNPTDSLKVYRIVPKTISGLSISVDANVVAVPAGSSRTVKIIARAESQGTYNFDVNVFSGEKLVSTTTLNANVSGTSYTSPVAVLTIILAIIFLVLLVILIVLLGKKPEKTEEFGESYY